MKKYNFYTLWDLLLVEMEKTHPNWDSVKDIITEMYEELKTKEVK